MPKWSKTREIKFSENEQIAILRKAKFNHKTWDKVSPNLIDQKTINELSDFEKEEEIKIGYDEKDNRIYIHYLPDYRDKLALK